MVCAAASVVVFAAALSLEAFHWGDPASTSGPGWRLLLQGWRALPRGFPEWLANPLLIFSWISAARGRRGTSLLLASSAAGLMLVFPLRPSVHAAGTGAAIHISPGPGYWLWLGSALLMVAAPVCGAARYDFSPGARAQPKDAP